MSFDGPIENGWAVSVAEQPAGASRRTARGIGYRRRAAFHS
jgi:hypothetical protein